MFDNNVGSDLPERPIASSCILGILRLPRIHDAIRSESTRRLMSTNATLRQGTVRLAPLAAGRRRRIPERPARTPQRRPDPMALQGRHRQRLDRSAPSRRGPVARLPLARTARPDDLDKLADNDGIVCIPACGAKPPPPSACSRSCTPPTARSGPTSVLHKLLTEPGARPGPRSTTGSATSSSSSTASGSTTARSSGTSGTVARTASRPW